MTRVYISGAITGTTDYMERFASIESKLLSLGYEVVNPSTILSHIPITSNCPHCSRSVWVEFNGEKYYKENTK